MRGRALQTLSQTSLDVTVLPFLYETRTLAFLRGSKRPPFISTSSLQGSSSHPRESSNAAKRGSAKPLIRRVYQDGGQAGVVRNANPSFQPHRARFEPGPKSLDTEYEIEFEGFEGVGNETYQDEADPSDTAFAPRTVKESTITPSEKATFSRIFQDIMAKKGPVGPDQGLSRHLDSGYKPNKTTAGKAWSQVDAQMPNRRGTGISFENKTIPQIQEQIKDAVDRYPRALRAQAARAFGAVGSKSNLDVDTNTFETSDELESLRDPMRQRVERAMRAARSDADLWQCMEQEVFSMIPRFGLSESGKSDRKHATARRKKKGASGKDSASQSIIDQSLDISVYGPLYPSYLLLGFRLLQRSFSKPSPLLLNILPRIKSLGVISHVLGASTALYNELLRTMWLQYNNLRAVERLLEEMDQAGLDLNAETKDIVNGIIRTSTEYRQGRNGTALQILWSMPEFSISKIQPWRKIIQESIDIRSKEMDEALAWKPEEETSDA